MKKAKVSLKMSLMTTIVICWLVPLLIVVAVASVLLENSYQQSVQRELDDTAKNAMSQVQMRLQDAISGSKAVSYDGVIRSAYRAYLLDGKPVPLFLSAKEYLAQSFSRDEKYKAVFISFWDESIPQPYIFSSDSTGYQFTQVLQEHTGQILNIMNDADTEIRFLYQGGELYMARNLLDSSFTPYATVVMMLDGQYIFGALSHLGTAGEVQVFLDNCTFLIDNQKNITSVPSNRDSGEKIEFSTETDGHTFVIAITTETYDVWADNPWLLWDIIGVSVMVLPLLSVFIILFTHHVSRPIQTLADAHLRVQNGQRGYQIDRQPPNVEFQKLYSNFNAMSAELKSQFERSYLEQQAAQRAQIKALQSQINPHFLNNTLEIINWEARLADNERVSAMIEALSTMLDATLDRDGRPKIPLRQELVYVDAYLYIIQERLGEGFHVHKQIDESILDQPIPRLLLQPIVENAVEHDITERRGGNLWVRVYRQAGQMILEVEHDGTMTQKDQENIRLLLSSQSAHTSSLGLRNVNQRLQLIYGEKAALRIEQTNSDTVLAQIKIPIEG